MLNVSSSLRNTGAVAVLFTAFLVSGPHISQNIVSLGVQEAEAKSNLPVPRFVSLKSKRVNMRVGPGRNYDVQWMYTKAGLPVEIIQEFDNWRRVRDAEGDEGWVLHALLSGKRTAIVMPWEKETGKKAELKRSPEADSKAAAILEAGVIADVTHCDEKWCSLKIGKTSGFIEKDKLWGVYPDEKIDD